jgi:hypothetical protein
VLIPPSCNQPSSTAAVVYACTFIFNVHSADEPYDDALLLWLRRAFIYKRNLCNHDVVVYDKRHATSL